MPLYKDPVIQKYLDLIKDNTTGIKGFYNGIMVKIPASMLPAVMIEIENTEVDEHSNFEDVYRIGLVITYIADIRKSFEQSAFIVAGLNDVKDRLIGRESDYSLKTSSILYLLRNNLNIDTGNNLRTDVGGFSVVTPNEIASGRFPGFFSAEGTIRFSAHLIKER